MLDCSFASPFSVWNVRIFRNISYLADQAPAGQSALTHAA